jgi:hypothetical protein
MDKAFSPADIEPRIYERWENSGYFQPSGHGPPYSIVIPPPNVTGTLHMGHAFQDTIMDALTRHHRMLGFATLWQPGTDHAGIATQMVVERQLNAAGTSRTTRTRSLRREGMGMEGTPRAARSPDSCVGWAHRWIGRASASRWIPSSPRRSPKPSFACIEDGSDLPRQAAGQLGSGAAHGAVGSGSRVRGRAGHLWHLRIRCATAAGIWSWRRLGRKPCSATPRSPCIPTMSATGT